MSRGKQGEGLDNLKVLFGRIKGIKQKESIYIELTESLGEKDGKKVYNVIEEKYSYVAGQLKRVELIDKEFEGQKSQDLRLWLADVDAGEMVILSVGAGTIIGRSIINTLLTLEQPFGIIRVNVWTKDGWNKVGVLHNDLRMSWKYNLDEQNALVITNKLKRKGVDVVEKDYYQLDEKLVGELKTTLVSKFDKTPKEHAAVGAAAPVDATAPATDDLPF